MKRLFISALAALAIAFSAQAATLSPITLLNPAGSTSGQAIVSTGASTAPAWGNVTAAALAAQAANTVLANATGASASPTAFAMPSCSATGAALNWTTSTGFTCQTGLAPLASPTFSGTVTAPTISVTTLTAGAGGIGSSGGLSVTAGGATITGNTVITGTASATAITHSQQERDTSYSFQQPTTGQTVTMAAGTETLLIAPAGTLANLTITMPGCNAGYDGSLARFVSFQNITALTLNATSGTVTAPNTSLTIGVGHEYICRGVATNWYPLY